MVNENLKPIIENKKPVETVQEIENYQIKKSPLSPAARNKVINKSSSGYVSERGKEGYGRMQRMFYYGSGREDIAHINENSILNVDYWIYFGRRDKNYFFELPGGELTTSWKIDGNLAKLRDEEFRLNEGEIKIVKLNFSTRNYERVKDMEEKVKTQFRRDIRDFDLAIRNNEKIAKRVSIKFDVPHADTIICYEKIIYSNQ